MLHNKLLYVLLLLNVTGCSSSSNESKSVHEKTISSEEQNQVIEPGTEAIQFFNFRHLCNMTDPNRDSEKFFSTKEYAVLRENLETYLGLKPSVAPFDYPFEVSIDPGLSWYVWKAALQSDDKKIIDKAFAVCWSRTPSTVVPQTLFDIYDGSQSSICRGLPYGSFSSNPETILRFHFSLIHHMNKLKKEYGRYPQLDFLMMDMKERRLRMDIRLSAAWCVARLSDSKVEICNAIKFVESEKYSIYAPQVQFYLNDIKEHVGGYDDICDNVELLKEETCWGEIFFP